MTVKFGSVTSDQDNPNGNSNSKISQSEITDQKPRLNLFKPVGAQLSYITDSQKRHGHIKLSSFCHS